MAYEKTKAPYNEKSKIPENLNWETLINKDGDELESHYRHILENLAKEDGMLGLIFRKSQNKISDPSTLKRVISEIGKINWNILGVDVIFDHKGDPWLLEFNASPSFSIEFNPSGEKGTKFNKTIWPIS